MFKRPLIYVQVHQGYVVARLIGKSGSIRKDCDGLIHPRSLIGDFEKVRECLAVVFKELLPKLRLRRPWALLHMIPVVEGGYTTVELRGFKQAAEAAGISFCWLSTYERLHTDSELQEMFK
jgi:hypothetical protein